MTIPAQFWSISRQTARDKSGGRGPRPPACRGEVATKREKGPPGAGWWGTGGLGNATTFLTIFAQNRRFRRVWAKIVKNVVALPNPHVPVLAIPAQFLADFGADRSRQFYPLASLARPGGFAPRPPRSIRGKIGQRLGRNGKNGYVGVRQLHHPAPGDPSSLSSWLRRDRSLAGRLSVHRSRGRAWVAHSAHMGDNALPQNPRPVAFLTPSYWATSIAVGAGPPSHPLAQCSATFGRSPPTSSRDAHRII